MMTEDDAQTWLRESFDVPRGTWERLQDFVNLLAEENARQNLVSASTLPEIWSRHIVDSAQLIRFAPQAETWLDLGTGAGFPGLIIALLHPSRVTMVESRSLRVAFLEKAASVLDLPAHTRILCERAEKLPAEPFDAITARAFAPLDTLLRTGACFATPGTCWILPKGRSAKSELDSVESSWQGAFSVEPSLTDADAGIIVARGVHRRAKESRAR